MSKLVVFAEEKNAAAFRDLFEKTVWEKVQLALAERKKHVAEKLSAQMNKQLHHNPAEDEYDLDLMKDVRGSLGIDASKKASPKGGMGGVDEGARTDALGLNADELDKGPGMGGGFTNEVPLAHVSYKPHIPAGQTKLHSKETAKGK